MYRKKPNYFLIETLLPLKKKDMIYPRYGELERKIPDRLTNNLSAVSALYIYTGTPPHGYGTQAPNVAETVNRSYEYNRKRENKDMLIGDFKVERMQWEKRDGRFPHDKIHGNYIPFVVKEMTENFLMKYCTHIDATVDEIWKFFINTNSDILTKGRQTFCPFSNQSVTAVQAYETAYNFLKENTGEKGFGCLEWIQAFLSLYENESLKYTKIETEETESRKFNKATKQHITKTTRKGKRVTKKSKGLTESRKLMREYCCRFASYIKHKERGKKDRRAIASPGMFMRKPLQIVEAFHLQLSKQIPGSTISIGG